MLGPTLCHVTGYLGYIFAESDTLLILLISIYKTYRYVVTLVTYSSGQMQVT